MYRSFFALLVLVLGAMTTQGCLYYPYDGAGDYAPEILNTYVGCAYDDYYGQNYWYFEADITDYDRDLEYAAVDVYDGWGQYVESWELVPDGGNRFIATVYEEYSRALDCRYSSEFTFEFWAQDYRGYVTEALSSGPPSYQAVAPELSQPTVGCYWDPAYGDYYWDFSVYATDPQGMADLRDVVLSIYQPGYDIPVEEWDLEYDSYYNIWSLRVYEYDSYYLDCGYNPTFYGYQFSATDWSGNLSWINATTVHY